MYDSRIENLSIQNWTVHCFDIEHTENMIISGITLDNSTGDAPRSASGSKPAAQPTASISPLAPTSPVEQLDYIYGGHGLSIGSIGSKSDNTVDGVSNTRYENVTVCGITDYGMDTQQDYLNGGPTDKPTNGVKIENITFVDVTGTMRDGKDYYILCGDGSCSSLSLKMAASPVVVATAVTILPVLVLRLDCTK
ncbi:hypothetical protein KXW02_007886 [Aspergillus fumigatus]|nr:hypothetical protein KXW02_007886 [Aspergillus fumigatus]